MGDFDGTIVGSGPGVGGVGLANVPGVPAFVSNGTLTITFSVDELNNDPIVGYALFSIADDQYIDATGTPAGATGEGGGGEVWQDADTWDLTGVTVDTLTDFTLYTFKAKARNEALTETAFSGDSAAMNTLPLLDPGTTSDNTAREKTGGNTKIDPATAIAWETNLSNNLANAGTPNVYYGDILFTYILQNEDSETSSIVVEFSENYNPVDQTGDWSAATEGAGGDGTTGLNTSAAGKSHDYSFDSFLSNGKSELDLSVFIRITPKDLAGDSGTIVVSGVFGVNNRPAKLSWTMKDERTYDKDPNPPIIAVLESLRAGTRAFPVIRYERQEDGGGGAQEFASYKSIAGWKYQEDGVNFIALTVVGILETFCDGINLCQYTPQTALENGNYLINGELHENRDRG